MASRIGKNALERQRLIIAERGSNGAGDEQGVSSALGEVLSTFVNGGLTAVVQGTVGVEEYILVNNYDYRHSEWLQKICKSVMKFEALNDADKELLAICREERDFVIFNFGPYLGENSRDVSVAPVEESGPGDRVDFASTFEVSVRVGDELTKDWLDQKSPHMVSRLREMARKSEQLPIRPLKISAPLEQCILDNSPGSGSEVASPTHGSGVAALAAPSVPPSVPAPTSSNEKAQSKVRTSPAPEIIVSMH